MKFPEYIMTTLRIQPAVLLFCSVSVLAKVASGFLPKRASGTGMAQYMKAILMDWRLVLIVALMFCVLALYAFIWQRLIKGARIAVIYANKSSGVLWSQAAAVCFFRERLSLGNILGICIIFAGILLANMSAKE